MEFIFELFAQADILETMSAELGELQVAMADASVATDVQVGHPLEGVQNIFELANFI